MIRAARPADAPMLARLHVQSWRETYPGLLPETEIAARGYKVRLAQWRNQIARGDSRIALLPDLGFAQMGPQRDAGFARAGYPEELYCIYLLHAGQGRGQGRALLGAVRGEAPFTALVLAGNGPACGFYRAMGGTELLRRMDHVGLAATEEIAFGFGAPNPD